MTLTGLRALVVEDEAVIAMMIEDFLTELGCEMVAMSSRLHHALERARTLELDIGILDINLAGKLSFPVAEVLQERGVPFVFETGYGAAAVPAVFQNVPVLCKPFNCEQLAQALQVVLRG